MKKNAVEPDGKTKQEGRGSPYVRSCIRALVMCTIACGLVLAGPRTGVAMDVVISATDTTGDACDDDDDADTVLDNLDLCPSTPLDAPTDADGCSGAQRVDRACGAPSSHPNYGTYVSCVVHAANAARQAGLITTRERARLVTNAARSN